MKIGNWSTKDERGVVALITAIVVGLLLVVITTSAIALMSKELRQASDFDKSIKAYYAAESGVEDALAEIRHRIAAGEEIASDDCAPYSSSDADLSGDGEVAYTCQIVTTQANQVTGNLSAEDSVQLDLSGIANFNTLVVSWNQRGSTDPQELNNIPTEFPPGNEWNGVYPAVLEVSIIDYPKLASFDSTDIGNRTAVLKPSSSGSINPNVNLTNINHPESVRCQPASLGGYDCQATFIAFSDNANHVLRLSTRYSQANYKIEAFQGVNVVSIPNAVLAIDVTGKAGDVFRRTLVRVPLSDQPSARFVILSGEAICKVFEVTDIAGLSYVSRGGEEGCDPD